MSLSVSHTQITLIFDEINKFCVKNSETTAPVYNLCFGKLDFANKFVNQCLVLRCSIEDE